MKQRPDFNAMAAELVNQIGWGCGCCSEGNSDEFPTMLYDWLLEHELEIKDMWEGARDSALYGATCRNPSK